MKHSQEKKKYTQDLGYPNLPQQQYCPSATVSLLIMKILHRAFLLAYTDEFFIRKSATTPLKQKGCIYTTFRGLTASLGDSPPQRYFTTYNITKIRESWAHITMTQRNYYIKMVASATLSENHNFSLTIWFLYLMLSGGEGTLTTASPVAATCCWRKNVLALLFCPCCPFPLTCKGNQSQWPHSHLD